MHEESIYTYIHHLRIRYLELAPKNKALLDLINESEVGEQVYNSNAIENSTLSLDETEKILLQVDLDRYISERELFEAKNLARVITYISTKAMEQELDMETILLLHKMLLTNINDDIAGRFRNNDEWVRVGNYIALDPARVMDAMEKLLIDYQINSEIGIIRRMALFHLGFEHIHPFVDGNGRIGRVLNNYLLLRGHYVPINIKFIDRQDYYKAFREFELNGRTKIMEAILGKALTNSLHKRLAYLERKEIVKLSEYAKRFGLSHSNLINKAKRQTIEAFHEKGIWKIGV